jgi:hypothetical protein
MESEFIKSFSFTTQMPDDESWKLRNGHISASALKDLKVSPLHFIEKEKLEPTPALIFGRAYHKYILEPSQFEQDYFVFDERNILEKLLGEGAKSPRATNAYKEWHEAQLIKAEGKEIIDLPTLDKLEQMKKRLFRHRYAYSLLNNGEAETSLYCTIETMDNKTVKLIMRPDYLKTQKRVVVELKTAIDASKEGFPKACAEFDYHIQAAIYKDLMEKVTGSDQPWDFYYVVQETKAPYAFNIFEASAKYIAQGRYEYEQLILLFNQCIENDSWPGYQVWCQNQYGINEINLPPWGIKDLTFYNHK